MEASNSSTVYQINICFCRSFVWNELCAITGWCGFCHCLSAHPDLTSFISNSDHIMVSCRALEWFSAQLCPGLPFSFNLGLAEQVQLEMCHYQSTVQPGINLIALQFKLLPNGLLGGPDYMVWLSPLPKCLISNRDPMLGKGPLPDFSMFTFV